jgi:hypothetical protein
MNKGTKFLQKNSISKGGIAVKMDANIVLMDMTKIQIPSKKYRKNRKK